MIVDNIEEKLTSRIPFWKLIKIKTSACSFLELTKRMEPILYDGNKLNCVFPYNCDALPISGNFVVVLLARNMDQITYLEESLKELLHANKPRRCRPQLPPENIPDVGALGGVNLTREVGKRLSAA